MVQRESTAILHGVTLRGADEVLMTSTAVEVLGVTSIDDQPVGNGQVGPLTQRLYDQFNRAVRGT